MNCKQCNTALTIPGEAPGWFFIVFVILLTGAMTCALFDYLLVSGFFLLGSFYAAAATWTNLGDSSSMGSDGRNLGGVRCKKCGHINKLRPWTL